MQDTANASIPHSGLLTTVVHIIKHFSWPFTCFQRRMWSTTRRLFTTQNTRTMASYSRLVRFHPRSDPSITLIGQPKNSEQDVGLASFAKEDIEVEVFSGESILEPGKKTGKTETVDKLLSPLSQNEVGTIRCIGLNVSRLIAPANSPPGVLTCCLDQRHSTSTMPRK